MSGHADHLPCTTFPRPRTVAPSSYLGEGETDDAAQHRSGIVAANPYDLNPVADVFNDRLMPGCGNGVAGYRRGAGTGAVTAAREQCARIKASIDAYQCRS